MLFLMKQFKIYTSLFRKYYRKTRRVIRDYWITLEDLQMFFLERKILIFLFCIYLIYKCLYNIIQWFFYKPLMEIFYYLMFFKAIAIIVPLLIAVAYFTLLERKIMASIQRRKGPNVVGYLGLLQPLADGLKLFVKETIIPSNSNFFIFLLAPVITFTLSLLGWAVIPFNIGLVASNINVGLLYLLTISSLSVYGILLAGWSSNSKYAFLGALRSISQMISYEISISFILLTVILSSGSLNLTEIVVSQQKIWYIFILFPSFLMFFVSALAETNRHPFDLPEAEAELVSGYNVEYSGMAFALFFLGEYANMLLMSALTTILFFGGWLPFTTFTLFAYIPAFIWFGGKLLIFVILFCVIRAAVPRYRYDQLMSIGWKTFLPISISWFLFISAMVYSFNTSLFGVSYLMYF